MSAAPLVCIVAGAGSAATTSLAGPLAANGYAVALVTDQPPGGDEPTGPWTGRGTIQEEPT